MYQPIGVLLLLKKSLQWLLIYKVSVQIVHSYREVTIIDTWGNISLGAIKGDCGGQCGINETSAAGGGGCCSKLLLFNVVVEWQIP